MYDPSRGYPVVVPCLLYDDLPAASTWLVETLGFREMLRATLPDGWTGHIELERDGFVLLLGRKGGQFASGSSLTQVFVDDVEAACGRGVTAGGELLDPAGERPGACSRRSSPIRRASAGWSRATSVTPTRRTGTAPSSGRCRARRPESQPQRAAGRTRRSAADAGERRVRRSPVAPRRTPPCLRASRSHRPSRARREVVRRGAHVEGADVAGELEAVQQQLAGHERAEFRTPTCRGPSSRAGSRAAPARPGAPGSGDGFSATASGVKNR